MGGCESTARDPAGDARRVGVPPLSEEEQEKEVSVVKAVALLAAAWGVYTLLGGDSDDRMMRAPGRGDYIRRADFESDPAAYFRDLRDR